MGDAAVEQQIGFLGSGQMAQALASGFIRAGHATPKTIVASDVSETARAAMKQTNGCRAVADNLAVVADARVLILAVKPQVVDPLLAQIRSAVTGDHLIISIAAGVPIARLAGGLGDDRRIVRVMPNTPCLVGASASGLAVGGSATDADAETAIALFRSVGTVHRLPESLLDAVTGLSGSGPAFVYQWIEALGDGGVLAGLPRDVASALAAQTVFGAAKMVLETGLHPGQLKDMVASPGGTTIEGLGVLERRAVRGAIIEAVKAASDRSRELGLQ
jgi:pyrroline-5-carboxylate reductase